MAIQLTTGLIYYIFAYIFLFLKYLRHKSPTQVFWYSCFIVYICMVIDVTIFPLPMNMESIKANHSFQGGFRLGNFVNLVPNLSLANVLSKNFFLNMVMTAPFGFLINIIYIKKERLLNTLKYALSLTIGIELIQLILRIVLGSYKYVDIDDVIANTTGALIGLGIYVLYDMLISKFLKG